MKIAIVTLSNRPNNYVKYANKTKKLFADKHENIDYIFIDHVLLVDKHPYWSKIPATLSVLDSYDYVIWMDDDVMITNFTFNVEQYFDDHDIYYTNDNFGLNVGVYVIKNTQIGHEFLNEVLANYEKFKNSHWPEQDAMKFLLNEKYSQYAIELPNKLWNTYTNLAYKPNNLWTKESFVLHLAGIPINSRDIIFYKKLQELGLNND